MGERRRLVAVGLGAWMAITLAIVASAAVAGAAAAPAAPAGASTPTAPATTATLPSASQIDAYLATKGSPMAGSGSAFMSSGARWQVDPRLVVAIAGAESNFGQITCASFNAWGWGCPNNAYSFESWADGFDTVMEGLRTNYLAEGRISVALIHQKYAPVGAGNDPTGLNNYWTINVSNFLAEQGGNPNNVDLSGVGGTMPLGLLLGDVASFDFAEEVPEDADGAPTAAADPDAPDLVVAAGDPRDLEIVVRNTGQVAWRPEEVRLRRVDIEERVGGAPFGAIAGDDAIEPDGLATFHVQLTAVGAQDGVALTEWRLEGPSGPFGAKVERTVRFEVPAFVMGTGTVDTIIVTGDPAPGFQATSEVSYLAKVQNAGSTTWVRDGDLGVVLGVRGAAGKPLTPVGWLSPTAPARMLERSAAPGEFATFAFKLRGSGGALALVPFTSAGWAFGDPMLLTVGNVAPAQLALLDSVNEPGPARQAESGSTTRTPSDPVDRGTSEAPA